MKRCAFLVAVLVCCSATASSDTPKRPHILGIAYVRIFVSNVDKARNFYSAALHAVPPPGDPKLPCAWCERAPTSLTLKKNHLGLVELETLQGKDPTDLLNEIAFETSDVRKLREFLQKYRLSVEKLKKCGEDPCFTIRDPENHTLVFLQRSDAPSVEVPGAYSPIPFRSPIIHAGFIVRDRAATEHFYKDILGFRPYWHGGMKDHQTDWVSMQVPDGTDWLEFMVNVEPNADQRLRGIMNHIAIGVPDIHAAQKKLQENGVKLTEEPKIGRDGKWQLNLYDPDLTRIEFMEFTPVQKPCCSDFTGPHPGPQSPSKASTKP